MWARRCGAPPLWPSRVKVAINSMVVAAIGMAIYQFMIAADVMYLDLTEPLNSSVLCLDRWPLRYNSRTASWVQLDMWMDWYAYRRDTSSYIREHSCMNAPETINTCNAVAVPLASIKENLGMSFVQPHDFGDVALDMSLEVFSHSFLYLSILLWLAVVVHDMSLLNPKNRNSILDFIGIRRRFPWFTKMFRFSCWSYVIRFVRSNAFGASKLSLALRLIVAICSVPVCAVWSVFFWTFMVCPFFIMCFARYPIKLSRLLIFVLCLACAVIGIFLTVTILMFLGPLADHRPAYAVIWDSQKSAMDTCICGCTYRISQGKCRNVLIISIGMIFQSLLLAFRCLKGLRRSNWGNLMSVTFTVPLAVYNVEWTQPDKKPIRFRTDGEPVQGELAFDPFALMDEQPDSAWTLVNLHPTLKQRCESEAEMSRRHEGPLKTARALKAAEKEIVGCCGCPCRAPLSDSEDDDTSDTRDGSEATEVVSTDASEVVSKDVSADFGQSGLTAREVKSPPIVFL